MIKNMKEIYDIVTKKNIIIEDGQITATAKYLNLSYGGLNHLFSERILYCDNRYILPKNKHLIFTLVNLETGEKYDCITNKTIEIYLKCKLTKNETKYIYEILKQRQKVASIQDVILFLDDNPPIRVTNCTKNTSKRYELIRKQQTLEQKIIKKIRGRVWSAVKRAKNKKLCKTQKLLGCSIDFFMGYLESKFTNGMSWDNYGQFGWNIDHIKPCATFNLSLENEQIECFNYKNCQPLWATTEIAMKYGENNSYIGNLNKNKY